MSRRNILAGLAIMAALGLPGCGERISGAQFSDGQFAMEFYDPGEGVIQDEVRSLPFKHIEWDYRFNGGRRIARMTLTGGQLFIETPENEVLAMDRFTGKTQWIFKIETDTPLDWAPVVAHGVPEEIRGLEAELTKINRRIGDSLKEAGAGEATKALQKKRSEFREKLKPAAFGDNVYLISRQVLYCLDRLSGGLRWTRRLQFIPGGQPFAIRNFVFVPGVDRARVWALDVDDKGSERTWFKADIGKSENHIMNRPIYSAPSLFFVSHDGRVYSYNVDSGDLSWYYQTERSIRSDPAIYKYKHKVAAARGPAPASAALPPADPAAPGADMPAPPGGAAAPPRAVPITTFLFVGAMDNAFYAIDADGGNLVWKYECGAPIKTRAIAKDETVYVATDGGALHAFEVMPQHLHPKTGAPQGLKRNGRLRWKIPLARRFLFKGAERVYVEGPNGEIWAVEEMTGHVVGRYPTLNLTHVMSNSVDDYMYVASPAGYVYCLKESEQRY